MAPKQKDQAQTKAEDAKRAQKVADRTFGLKNKNKSKVVQSFVKAASMPLGPGGGGGKQVQGEGKKKADAEAQKAALMNSLFANMSAAGIKKAEEKAKKEKEEKAAKEKAEQEARKAAALEEMSPEMQQLRRCLARVLRDYRNGVLISAIKNMVKGLDQIGFVIVESNFGYDKFTDLIRSPHLEDILKIEIKPNGTIALRPPEWRKSDDEEDNEIPLEELIEMQRKTLQMHECTPVDAENFKAWLEIKAFEKEQAAEAENKVKVKKGQVTGPTGRELFIKDASLFKDDEDATDDIDYSTRIDGMQAEGEEQPGAIDAAVFEDDAELPDDLDD